MKEWLPGWRPCVLKNWWLRFCVSACLVDQSCLTLCNPMDCSLPGSSVYENSQARILEWVAISYSRESSPLRDWTHNSCVSCIGRLIIYHYTTWETPTAFLSKSRKKTFEVSQSSSQGKNGPHFSKQKTEAGQPFGQGFGSIQRTVVASAADWPTGIAIFHECSMNAHKCQKGWYRWGIAAFREVLVSLGPHNPMIPLN